MWCVQILQEHDSISRQHSQTSCQPGKSFWRFHCHQAATTALFYNLYVFAGPWFNIKMPSYQYRKSHCGDKTILRPSYLHNGISYIGKTSLYWIRTLFTLIFWLSTWKWRLFIMLFREILMPISWPESESGSCCEHPEWRYVPPDISPILLVRFWHSVSV